MNALAPRGLQGLLGVPYLAPPPVPVPGWLWVEHRFERLFAAIAVTDAAFQDGITKASRIAGALNRTYWPLGPTEPKGILAGSWGKRTRVHPSADLDLLYVLPPEVYWRYQARTGNRQSDLLQEIKSQLAPTYPNTTLRGDRQVLVVNCASIMVEVVPVFDLANGQFLSCDTKMGGSYKVTDPRAEFAALDVADHRFNGRVRRLVRLAKLWKRSSGADIPSFALELLAVDFMAAWMHSAWDWWDWMMRDFLSHLIAQANTWVHFPVTREAYWLGDSWKPRAEHALRAAETACTYEHLSWDEMAAVEWSSVFGRKFLGA